MDCQHLMRRFICIGLLQIDVASYIPTPVTLKRLIMGVPRCIISINYYLNEHSLGYC